MILMTKFIFNQTKRHLHIFNVLQINPAVLFEKQDAEKKEARETVIKLVSRFM